MVSPAKQTTREAGDYTTELNAEAGFIKYSVYGIRFYRIQRAAVRTAAVRFTPRRGGGQGGSGRPTEGRPRRAGAGQRRSKARPKGGRAAVPCAPRPPRSPP